MIPRNDTLKMQPSAWRLIESGYWRAASVLSTVHSRETKNRTSLGLLTPPCRALTHHGERLLSHSSPSWSCSQSQAQYQANAEGGIFQEAQCEKAAVLTWPAHCIPASVSLFVYNILYLGLFEVALLGEGRRERGKG